MSIIRIKKKEHPYVQVDKRVLEDSRLSWRAKGILVYLLTKPDGWTVKVADIWGKGQEGRGAVQACLKELNKYGYAQLVTIKGDGTTFAGKEWQVNEEPIGGFLAATDKPKTDAPINRKPDSRAVNSNNESLSEINSNNEGERTPPAPNPSTSKEEKNESGLVAPGRRDPHQWQGQIIGPPAEYVASEPVSWKPISESEKESPSDKLSQENVSLSVKAETPPSKKVAPKKDSPAECDGSGGIGKIEFYPAAPAEDSFSQWLPSLHTAMENNAPGSMPHPAHFEVTAIASPTELPGVTLVEAAPIHHRRNGRIEIPDEAAAEILPWAKGDGEQTVKSWYDRAFRQHSPKDVEDMVMRFSTVFLSSEKAAFRDMMETNPLSFFKRRFAGFVADQKQYDRNNAPKEGGPTRQTPPQNYTSSTRH